MSKHAQSRAVVLQAARTIRKIGRRTAKCPNITDQDYAAVPPPLNLQVHPAGDCLVWLWNLNADGYGTAAFAGRERLAHRQAFQQSRHRPADLNVLHLCHRPFCVQPSHLYDGSAKENSEDRRIRTSGELHMDLFTKKAEIVQAVAKYRWPSPTHAAQEPLIIAPAQHDCEFIVPAMDRLICPTCGRDNLSDDTETYIAGAPQPNVQGRNVESISRRSRSFRNLAGGIAIETNITTNYSIPLNRAERRRREKAARKSPFRDRPVLLGSNHVKFKPGDTAHVDLNMEDLPLTGPGVLLLTATPIKSQNDDPDAPEREAARGPSRSRLPEEPHSSLS